MKNTNKTANGSARWMKIAALLTLFGILCAMGVHAQGTPSLTGFPAPDLIYSGLSSPFNSALTWVIGAIAVLLVIKWVRRAANK